MSDNMLILAPAPHITKENNSTAKIMLNVLIALIPAIIYATFFFGFMVIVNILSCVVFCAGFELLYEMIEKKNFSKRAVKESGIWNFSCAVTGVILALNLPSKMNLFSASSNAAIILSTLLACLLGSFIAIVIAKMLFGGIGRNFANPALLGRIFLLLCFSGAITAANSTQGVGLSAVTGATWLSEKGPISGLMLFDMFVGNIASAAVGETSALAILMGFVYLCVTRTIDFKLPLIIMGSVFTFALLFEGTKLSGINVLNNSLAHVLSGGILFGAVFMATDYATSPNTRLGTIIYGIGIGLLTMLIRSYNSNLPDGASFAIMLMNLVTPILDKYIIPRPYGVRRKND